MCPKSLFYNYVPQILKALWSLPDSKKEKLACEKIKSKCGRWKILEPDIAFSK
jgi:hypothetical protein